MPVRHRGPVQSEQGQRDGPAPWSISGIGRITLVGRTIVDFGLIGDNTTPVDGSSGFSAQTLNFVTRNLLEYNKRLDKFIDFS